MLTANGELKGAKRWIWYGTQTPQWIMCIILASDDVRMISNEVECVIKYDFFDLKKSQVWCDVDEEIGGQVNLELERTTEIRSFLGM